MKHLDSNTLWNYVTGDSSNDQSAHIKKHLSNCEDCMGEFELLRQIDATLHAIDEETLPFGFSDVVIRKIENEVVLERKIAIFTKLFPYTILGSFALAFLTAIIASVGLDLDLTPVEAVLNSQIGILILTACGLLWGLYFIDRIFKKIFVPFDYTQFQ